MKNRLLEPTIESSADAPPKTVNGNGHKKHLPKSKPVRSAGKKTAGAKTIARPGNAPFPRTTFEDALILGNAIQQHGAGQQMRRLTLFEKLDKAPDSGPSRMMVTNSGKYKITMGGYQAEHLQLTELGQKATSPESSPTVRTKARFDLAIAGIPEFKHLYEINKGKRLPSPEVMRDALEAVNLDPVHRKECVELFLENAKFLGLLRTVAGAERLAPIEQVIDDVAAGSPRTEPMQESGDSSVSEVRNFDSTCFVISAIGVDGSEERKHANMILESLVERAMEGSGLEVIRADKISDPGMISGQVIEYLLKSALVVADLSFHNPNVFYELAIRHMIGLPTIHLIRKEDAIPFDVKDFRTIYVDTSDKYDLVAKLETYRAEISNHVRIARSSGGEGSNPVKVFARNLVVRLEKE